MPNTDTARMREYELALDAIRSSESVGVYLTAGEKIALALADCQDKKAMASTRKAMGVAAQRRGITNSLSFVSQMETLWAEHNHIMVNGFRADGLNGLTKAWGIEVAYTLKKLRSVKNLDTAIYVRFLQAGFTPNMTIKEYRILYKNPAQNPYATVKPADEKTVAGAKPDQPDNLTISDFIRGLSPENLNTAAMFVVKLMDDDSLKGLIDYAQDELEDRVVADVKAELVDRTEGVPDDIEDVIQSEDGALVAAPQVTVV